jgi:hypothetical protein
MSTPTEVSVILGIPFRCPQAGPPYRGDTTLPWDVFCKNLAWGGNLETNRAFGICFFKCPKCAKEHKITLPDNSETGD